MNIVKVFFLGFIMFLTLSTSANEKKIAKLEHQINTQFDKTFNSLNFDWNLVESSYYEYIKQYLPKVEKGKLKFDYRLFKNFWITNRGNDIKYFQCDSLKKKQLVDNFNLLGIDFGNVTNTIKFLNSIFEPFLNKKWQAKYSKEAVIQIGTVLSNHAKRDKTFLNHNDFVSYLIHKVIPEFKLDDDYIMKTIIIASFPDVVYKYTKEKE